MDPYICIRVDVIGRKYISTRTVPSRSASAYALVNKSDPCLHLLRRQVSLEHEPAPRPNTLLRPEFLPCSRIDR